MASSPDVSEEWSDSSVLHAVKAETDKRLMLPTHETRPRRNILHNSHGVVSSFCTQNMVGFVFVIV